MRHRKKIPKLSRTRSVRKLLLANMAKSLFQHGKIRTTKTKAKALRPYAEKLITRSKTNNLDSIRYLKKHLQDDKSTINKLLKDIGPKYKTRNGGYIRILKLENRKGDNAPMALVELV